MRASYLVTLLFIFKYSMENQNKSLFCAALFSLCGILDVCGIDLVEYIGFEIRTYPLVGSVQYTCPVVPLCIVDASLSHYVGNLLFFVLK